MIEAVCFDMDGILFDTERLSRDIMRELLAEQGAVLTDAVYLPTIGMTTHDAGLLMNRAYPGIDMDKMEQDRQNRLRVFVLAHGVPLKKGVPEVLTALRKRGMRLGIATSTVRTEQTLLVETAGLTGLFDAVVCGDEIIHGKPRPDIYLACAKKLDARPEMCAGVEDALNGLKALRAAGMFSVMVPDLLPYHAACEPYADAVIGSLTELTEMI